MRSLTRGGLLKRHLMPRIDEREEEQEKTHKSKLGFYGEREEREDHKCGEI